MHHYYPLRVWRHCQTQGISLRINELSASTCRLDANGLQNAKSLIETMQDKWLLRGVIEVCAI